MNAERRPGGAAHRTAGRRSTSIVFQSSDITACVRVDLARPANGDRFESGEVARRVHRAVVGTPTGVVLQLVVSAETPDYAPVIPEGARVQIVAPDGPTAARWIGLMSGGTE